MTSAQRFALTWLFTAALAAVAITWAGEAVLDAVAVPAPVSGLLSAGR